MPDEVNWLSLGPNTLVKKYAGYMINGFRFHTKSRERSRKTQNSGVVVTAQNESYSTSRDRRPISGDVDHFGVINEIIELDYYCGVKVVLFKCQWADVNNRTNGVKVDDYGFTLMNSERFSDTDEPFVLASQVQQVFYVEDPKEKPWQVVIRVAPRDLYSIPEEDINHELGLLPIRNESGNVLDDSEVTWVRDEVPATIIDENRNQAT